MQIHFYNAGMSAEARHHNGSHWVRITVIETDSFGVEHSHITLFFNNAADADNYAHAINSVTPSANIEEAA